MSGQLVFFTSVVVGLSCIYLFTKIYDSMVEESIATVMNGGEQYKNPVPVFFLLFLFSIFLFSMLLASKVAYEDYDYCQTLPVNSTSTGSLTSYDYQRVCFDNANGSDNGVVDLVNFMIIGTIVFLFVLIGIGLWGYLRGLYEEYKKN